MSDTIIFREPFDLRATLAKMKAAKEQGVNMNVWDGDIKAVDDAIALIESVMALRPVNELKRTLNRT